MWNVINNIKRNKNINLIINEINIIVLGWDCCNFRLRNNNF